MKRFLTLILLMTSSPLLFGVSSGPFIQISQTGGNAAPELAVAVNGNAFAAWLNFPNNIQTAFFNAAINPPTGQWFSLGTLAVGSVPQIGVDQNGNAFIVWVGASTLFGATPILVSRLNAATLQFSTPIQLSNTGTINSFPQISVNGAGVAVVIWIQSTPFQVLASSFSPPPGIGWSAPTPILSNTFPASFALDNFNRGIAIINSLSGQVQGAVQAARIFAP